MLINIKSVLKCYNKKNYFVLDVQNDTEDLLYASDTEQSFTEDFKSANFTETASMPIQQAKLDSSFNCNQGNILIVFNV